MDTPAPLYQSILSKHCRLEWIASQELYEHFDKAECREHVTQLLACRTRAWFVRNKTDGSVRVAANSCRLRWCPLCARARSNYIRHEVAEWFQSADHPKFLTVTLKHSQDNLTLQINRIYDSFRKLRKIKFFRDSCTGGIWFFQICWNPDRNEWHPHIHAIVTGSYMPYRKLRSLWYFVTGDSEVLDIRVVRDAKKVGDYVARYAARPCQLANIPFEQGVEVMMSLASRRLAGSWGTAKGISFRPKKIPDPDNWEYLGGWSIINELSRYDENAKAILKAYYCNLALGDGFSCYDYEAFIDGVGTMEAADLEVDPKPPPTLFD